jgi:hypothetical protein
VFVSTQACQQQYHELGWLRLASRSPMNGLLHNGTTMKAHCRPNNDHQWGFSLNKLMVSAFTMLKLSRGD